MTARTREVSGLIDRFLFEGFASATIWPPLADVNEQGGSGCGRNYINDKGSVQGNAYFLPGNHIVGTALIHILWLRASYIQAIFARCELRNRKAASLIGLSCGDLASALPLFQIPRRMLHAARVLDFTIFEERSIGPGLDGYRGAGHSDRTPFFVVTMSHQVDPPAASDRPRQLSHRRRRIASNHDYAARIKRLGNKKT